jgi:hypothetical protein
LKVSMVFLQKEVEFPALPNPPPNYLNKI